MAKPLPHRNASYLLILVLATACFFLPTALADAATYYVATDGDNSNPGTIEQPWATFAYGYQQLQAGDTLYLREGTYIQEYSGWGPSTAGDGTEQQPITIKSYPGEHAVIVTGPNTHDHDLMWVINDWIVFDGLEFTGAHPSVGEYGSGYGLAVRGQHLTVCNCTFHDFGSNHIKFHASLESVPDDMYATIEYCEFYNSPNYPFGRQYAFISSVCANHIDIHHNYLHDHIDVDMHIIQLKGGASNCSVHHNLIKDLTLPPGVSSPGLQACAIQIGGSTSPEWFDGPYEAEDCRVHNNIVYNCAGAGITFFNAQNCSAFNNTLLLCRYRGIYVRSASGTITIKNNIIEVSGYDAASHEALMRYDGGCGPVTSDYNVFRNLIDPQTGAGEKPFTDGGDYPKLSFAEWQAKGYDQNSMVVDDIGFVGYQVFDFHLMADSPAIDAGIYELGVPADDFDGNPRPYGDAIDIGAYEYTGAGGGNEAPVLAWAGETGYESDGLEPETGTAATDFTWKIEYSDPDSDAPYGVYLHVLEDGTELGDSPYDMM